MRVARPRLTHIAVWGDVVLTVPGTLPMVHLDFARIRVLIRVLVVINMYRAIRDSVVIWDLLLLILAGVAVLVKVLVVMVGVGAPLARVLSDGSVRVGSRPCASGALLLGSPCASGRCGAAMPPFCL